MPHAGLAFWRELPTPEDARFEPPLHQFADLGVPFMGLFAEVETPVFSIGITGIPVGVEIQSLM